MMLLRTIGLLAVAMCLSPDHLHAEDQIQTRIPQAHVDAFMNDCNKASVARATCWCMVQKFNETKAGAALVDMRGLFILVPDDAGRKKGFVAVLDRHGIRPSELQALLDPNSGRAEAVAKECS